MGRLKDTVEFLDDDSSMVMVPIRLFLYLLQRVVFATTCILLVAVVVVLEFRFDFIVAAAPKAAPACFHCVCFLFQKRTVDPSFYARAIVTVLS